VDLPRHRTNHSLKEIRPIDERGSQNLDRAVNFDEQMENNGVINDREFIFEHNQFFNHVCLKGSKFRVVDVGGGQCRHYITETTKGAVFGWRHNRRAHDPFANTGAPPNVEIVD